MSAEFPGFSRVIIISLPYFSPNIISLSPSLSKSPTATTFISAPAGAKYELLLHVEISFEFSFPGFFQALT